MTTNPAATGGLVLVFAHPDDEAFGCSGTMAAARAVGWPVTLICATRGELGDSGDVAIDDPDVLGAIREQELRAACAAVGVDDVRFLPRRDSGMAGTPANDDPRALHQAPSEQVAVEIAVQLRALRPRIVVTFGPEGIYGHPDHLKIHAAALQAVADAADPDWLPQAGPPWQVPALYFSALARDEYRKLAEMPDSPMASMSRTDWSTFGTPDDQITTWIDVSPWLAAKDAAMRAHRSQTGPGGPLTALLDPLLRNRHARETYVRVPLGETTTGDPLADLVAQAKAAKS